MNRNLAAGFDIAATVAVCATLGYVVSRFPAAAGTPAWLPTIGGALVGVVASAIGILPRDEALQAEREMSPRLRFGFQLGLSGLGVGIAGLVIAVLLAPNIGHVLIVVGWVGVAAGIVLIKLAKHAA